MTAMTDNGPAPTELWYRLSAKNLVIFALIWLGEALLILMFVKWAIHGSAVLYLLMIPWSLFGAIVVARPNWLLRVTRALERDMERVDKWSPPGFP
jgi:hypothetical protein